MRILLWLICDCNWLREFRRRKELSTTTGGEPVHEHASLIASIHKMDGSIVSTQEQVWLVGANRVTAWQRSVLVKVRLFLGQFPIGDFLYGVTDVIPRQFG